MRRDTPQEQTDVESFAALESTSDGFRNYLRAGEKLPPERLLVERANLLTLTAPEMTVLVGGMRALNATFAQSEHGVFTDRRGTLTNDFFVNLLDMGTAWKVSESLENVYEGRDRATGELKWTGAAVDLVFGSLRPRLNSLIADTIPPRVNDQRLSPGSGVDPSVQS